MSDDNGQFEQLTQNALEAAMEGKWDQVIALYDRRISQGQLNHLSPDLSRKLVKWDQWVLTRVREAQAAIQQNLCNIEDKRRKLEILKRQWGGNSTTETRYLLTI